MAENGSGTTASRNRSPLYPACDLETAIQKLTEFYQDNGPNEVHVDAAAEGWGYSAKSSTGKRIVAALIHFGLLEESGTGRDRTINVSGQGMDIVLNVDEPESFRFQKAVENAAVAPTIYAKLWERYGARLPARATVTRWLIDEGFNHKVIDDVIADYTSTMAYAGLESEDHRVYLGNDKDEVGKAPPHVDERRRVADQKQKDGTQPKREPMTAPGSSEVWDLTIRLPGDFGQAVLRMPVPVTPSVFEYLRNVLNMNLDLQEPALTRTEDHAEPDAE